MKLKFLGAAKNVTGSRHLLQVGDTHILCDCGLYQERAFSNRNWEPFPVPPSTIDAVLLTHAHLDHCGYLPKLVKDGFRGRIYATSATAELTKLILLDSAYIQEEDAEEKRERHKNQNRPSPHPEIPLYTVADAQSCFPLFSHIEYNQCKAIHDKITVCFYNAGHVLGSAIIQVKVKEAQEERTILFSGDMGRPSAPILNDPDIFEAADYILLESTYGDKVHDNLDNIKQAMADVIQSTQKAGGNIVVPSFALERAQEVLYYINRIRMEKRIGDLKVFVDSPMANKITEVFKKYPQLYDKGMAFLVEKGRSFFDLPGLEMVSTRADSFRINETKGTSMIIAGSGMCTGGRVKYHLISNIWRPESTIMFVGYQASGTLGRQILDGEPEVRIHGQMYPVRAKVVRIPGFSAHADRKELLDWLQNFKTPPRGIFVVHGEAANAIKFGDFLRAQTQGKIYVPDYLDEVTLE